MTDFKRGDVLVRQDGLIGKFREYWYDRQAVQLYCGEHLGPQVCSVEFVRPATNEEIAGLREDVRNWR